MKRALSYVCPPILNTTATATTAAPVATDVGNCSNCYKMGGGCYITSPNQLIRADAVTYCTNAGGQLPFFPTQTEYADFQSFVNCSFQKNTILLDYTNWQPHNGTNPGNWTNANGTGVTGYTEWLHNDPMASGTHMAGFLYYTHSVWIARVASNLFYTVCQCKANCNSSYTALGSNYFWDTKIKLSWTAAKSFCDSGGAQLTSFDNYQDLVDWNAFMFAYAVTGNYWLDYTTNMAHSPTNPGVWHNSNGTATNLSNWFWQPIGSGGYAIMTWNVNGWLDSSNSHFDIACTCEVVANAPPPVCITNKQTSTSQPVTGPDCSSCSMMGSSCFLTPDSGNGVSGPNAQYICQTLGGQLPTFQTATDWTDFTTYLSCTNKTYVILGYQNTNVHNSSNSGNWTDSYGNLTSQSYWFGEPLGVLGGHCSFGYPSLLDVCVSDSS